MSRPIPEGVEAPEGCVILGWGGEFKATNGGFDGWTMIPERSGPWIKGFKLGGNSICIYAADRDSEVALLNRKQVPLNSGEAYSSDMQVAEIKREKPLGCKCQSLAHKLNGDGCDECNPKLALEHSMTTISDLESEIADKDALIRELVRVAERANQLIYPMGDRDYELPDGYHIDGYLEAQQAATELSDALTLARTTCPEAFES